jgi:DNA processing protein
MITAEIADSYHRDVFAVPGKIEDPMSSGCNYLIKRGKAHLIEDANDLLKVMNWKENPNKRQQSPQRKLFVEISPRDEKILAFLREKGSRHSEEIAAYMQLNISQLALHLLELEMNGLVRSHPGSLYSIY